MAETKRYDIKEAHKTSQAKQSIDRDNKIAQVFRDKQELDDLEAELDSAKAKYDTPEKSAAYRKEINAKIVAQKKKLKTNSDAILKSSDKELVSEYKKTLADDKEVAKVVNYSANKKQSIPTENNNTMAKKKSSFKESNLVDYKGNKVTIKENISKKELEKLQLELKKIELNEEDGKQSPKYIAFQRQMYQKAILPTLKKEWKANGEKAQERFDNAETVAELESAKADVDQAQKYFDLVSDERSIGGWKDGEPMTEEAVTSYDRFLREVGEIQKVSDLAPEPEEQPVTPEYQGDDTPAQTGTPTTAQKEDITLLPPKPGTTTTSGGGDTIDHKADVEKAQAELDALNQTERERTPFEYAPDSQNDSDVLGSLMDVGRGALGMMGAMEEVPKYERGSMWQTAMGEAERMRDQGLSADELNYRNKQAETAYAYNVKNIRRGAGGSAGAYLGNVQSAAGGLYDEFGKTAAIDEGLRRQSRANFQSMAGQDENINRRIFEDDLSQVMANKEAGAGLVQDAIGNIKERRDYNKQYGKDSPWYQFQRDTAEEAHNVREDRTIANEERVAQNKREAEFKLRKAQEAYEGSPEGNLNPNEKPVAKEDSAVKPSGTSIVESAVAEAKGEEPKAVVQEKIGDKAYDEQEVSTGTKLNEKTGELEKTSKFTPKETKQPPEHAEMKASKAQIAKNIVDAEPKKNKERYKALKEAAKYGEMGDKEIAELELLEEAKKNGWRLKKKTGKLTDNQLKDALKKGAIVN